MARKAAPKTVNRPGPDALRIKSDRSFEDTVKLALSKKRPAGGWPEPPPTGRKKRTTKRK